MSIFSSKPFVQFLSEVSNFMFSFLVYLTGSFKFECSQVRQMIFYLIIFYFSFPFLVKVINILFAPQIESLEDILSYISVLDNVGY